MTDKQPAPESKGISPDILHRHEQPQEFTADDMSMLMNFTKRVGAELNMVDKYNVGSNSNIKAMRLERDKILSKDLLPVSKQPTQPIMTNQQKQASAPITTPVTNNSTDTDILKRIERIESSINTLKKAKRIKRGVSYNVCSNGCRGVLMDAELIAEFVITELAKGVKTITLKRNDSKNTEQD